jgi:hypothetical protein
LCIGLGTTSARASCQAEGGFVIQQGLGTISNGFIGGGSYDPASCGTDPFRVFWAIGLGNPVNGLGVDSGVNPGIFYDPLFGFGYAITSDWGNGGVDGCVLTPANLQADGTPRPQVMLLSNGFGEGTSAHSATYSALSVDVDTFFNSYNLDYAHATSELSCASVPVPAIGTSSGSGPFSVSLSWGGVSSIDDCGSNPDINLGSDCSGGSRSVHAGWKVYSKSAPCTVGTLTGDRSSWTQEGAVLAVGANAGSSVTISAAAAGQCRFVAINPVWDSGYEGQFLSGQAGPIGGSGDADGDGISDLTDKCPTTANADNSDGDGDGVGDICDNCPVNPNPGQADSDSDGAGDACDLCQAGSHDNDGDLVCSDTDNCPNAYNPNQADEDADGVGDVCDACLGDPTNDADGDGICGASDSCPDNANPGQEDTDGDGFGDACDACPFEALNDQDGDGICACDVALFNDDDCPGGAAALGTIYDNCPKFPNPSQTPSGAGDGLGADCDEKFVFAELTPQPSCNGGATPGSSCSTSADCQGRCSITTGTLCTSDANCPSGETCSNPAPGTCVDDNGFGDCKIRWRTSAEWNCPSYSVIYRSNSGDKSTGVSAISCTNCTRGGRIATYGGGGLPIASCHGGHNMYVLANRVVSPGGTACSAVKNYKTVVGRPVSMLASKFR